MRCRAEGGRKGRRRAELWVGPRSGLAPASAAAPERSGWRGPPFGSLALRTGPLDAARSRTRAGSLRPSPISGPSGARSTLRAVRLGSVFWERRSLWRPISGSPACLQGPGELSLSLSVADVECGRDRRAGMFHTLGSRLLNALEAPLPCRPLPRRGHRRFHPPTRASPESTPTGHLGLRSRSFACHLHTICTCRDSGASPQTGAS